MNATGATPNASYTPRRVFEAFALDYIKKSAHARIPLSEIRASFGNISRSTATRTMQRMAAAGLLTIRRYEQIWVECNTRHETNATGATNLNATLRRSVAPKNECNAGPRNERNSSNVAWSTSPLLGSHRIKFESIRYSGSFIKTEDTRYSGRYHSVPTTFFRFGTHTIVMHTKRIKIWIHDSKGKDLAAQKEDAKNKAIARLHEFAEMHRLLLEAHDLSKIAGSEHTFEDSSVDAVLRPIVEEESERMNERLGMAINQTSHPGKIELHERNPEVGSQFSRGQRIEYIIDTFAPVDLPAISDSMKKAFDICSKLGTKMIEIEERVKLLEVMR